MQSEAVKLTIPSKVYHLSQIITGFCMLRWHGWQVELDDRSNDQSNPWYGLPLALAQYRGKRLVYDLWDGYQNPDGMALGLANCDYYFKRSFDPARNQTLFGEDAKKMRPLGLNYHVTCRENPINEPLWRDAAKRLLGRGPERYFTPQAFEGTAEIKDGPVKILFLTQLWDTDDPGISQADSRERAQINQMRMEIVHTLRRRFGEQFIGGLDSGNARLTQTLAPELIVDRKLTERRQYLKTVHNCHICIGTMGLYESIGWKTAEYVAAAKAIVNERLHYIPTGDFAPGKNYLPFETVEECIQAVERLVNDREALYQMQKANETYYQNYLRPDILVKNTLEQVP